MRLRFIAAGMSAFLALLLTGMTAFAATPQTIAMQGRATVVSSGRTGQVRLVLQSSDGRGWLLDTTFNVVPVNREGEREREHEGEHERSRSYNAYAGVNGNFSLTLQQTRLASGTVSGRLNSDGTGDIRLADGNGATSLEVAFAIGQDGSVMATAQGQWPVVSPPQSAPSPTPAPAVQSPRQLPASAAPAQPAPQQPPQPPVNHFYWYLSRTSAIAAYILLFISICLGTGLRSRRIDWILERWRAFDLHQFTALLGGALSVLHVFSLLGDRYFNFSISDLLVPMSSPYRPFWTAMGIIGFYGLAVVALSSLLRKKIGEKAWKVLHGGSFTLFFTVLFHSIKGGTDTSIPWMQWMYVFTGAVAAFLLLWRVFAYRPSEVPQHGNVSYGPSTVGRVGIAANDINGVGPQKI